MFDGFGDAFVGSWNIHCKIKIFDFNSCNEYSKSDKCGLLSKFHISAFGNLIIHFLFGFSRYTMKTLPCFVFKGVLSFFFRRGEHVRII